MRALKSGERSMVVLVPILLLLSGRPIVADPMRDGPSVQALLELCDRGAANGGRGVEAAGCEWFAAPCACKLRGSVAIPWCVPEHVSIDEQVREVIAALRRLPDKTQPAESAVGAILGRLYPCPGDAVRE